MIRFAVAVALLASCVTAAPPRASSSPTLVAPSAAPVSSAATSRLVSFYRTESSDWFETRVPLDWYVEGPREISGRFVIREHVTISSRPIGERRIALNLGAYDWGSVPKDAVLLRAETICVGSSGCRLGRDETSFPLDLPGTQQSSAVRNAAAEAGFDVRLISVRVLDQGYVLWMYLGPQAPVRDEDRLAAVVAAITLNPPPPARGEFRGWTALGATKDRDAGGVWLERTASGAPFYLVRDVDEFIAFPTTYERWFPHPNCALRFEGLRFVCDATGDRWTKVGSYLGTAPESDLPRLRTVVRDGIVFVR